MSGIAGIWNLDARPVNPSELASLAAPLSHRATDSQRLWAEGSVGMASHQLAVTPESLSEIQPLHSPSGSVLVFDGRLDNREELFSDLADVLGLRRNSPDAAFVMAAYEYFGRGFAARLKGDFALGLYDPRAHALLLTRDLIGMRPLYYCRLPNIFLFASEIKAILAHPDVHRRVDEEGLAHVVLPGRAVRRELTCFDGIRTIVPGQLGIAMVNGWTQTQIQDFDSTRTVRCKSIGEYVEGFQSLFSQAVQRRLRSAFPVAISVSGGVDSSAIFSTAQNLRRSQTTLPTVAGISMGFPEGTPGDEDAFLATLERKYAVVIARVPWEHGNLRCAEAFVWHTELPRHHCLWNWQQSILQQIHQEGQRVVLTGFFGDQMLNAEAYLVDLLRSLRWGKVLHDLRMNIRWTAGADSRQVVGYFLLNLLKSSIPRSVFPLIRGVKIRIDSERYPTWYSQSLRDRAVARVRGQLRPDGDSSSKHALEYYQQLRSLDFLLRMEETNKMYAMYGLDTATPFLDSDLLAFLMAIPGEVVKWDGVPKGLFRQSMTNILPRSIRDRTSKGDSTSFVNETTQQELTRIRSYFACDCLSIQMGYVDGDSVQTQLKQLETTILPCDSAIASWNIASLLGLELWLRAFFGESTTRPAVASCPADIVQTHVS